MVDTATQFSGQTTSSGEIGGENLEISTLRPRWEVETPQERQLAFGDHAQIHLSTEPPESLNRTSLPTSSEPSSPRPQPKGPIFPKPLSRRGYVIAAQRWEGTVEEIGRKSFTAFLSDLETGVRERTEIDFDEVSEFDLPLVTPGAVFYWTIGYRVHSSGQREGGSTIIFRRLPVWTKAELNRARSEAEATVELFGWQKDTASCKIEL